MDDLIFYGDPHLGVVRRAHTTPASQARLRASNLAQLDRVLARAGHKICLGDLFDRYGNNESVIAQAAKRLARTDWLIAGNHDSTPSESAVGSLELLQTLASGQNKVVYAQYGQYGFERIEFDDRLVYGVPHVATQELFLQSLDEAREAAKQRQGFKILALHCNYDSPWALSETTLNLTRGTARELLGIFDYIVIGHEHNARVDFDGHVIITGNLFPTRFDELTDKKIVTFKERTPSYDTIWSAADHCAEYTADTLPTRTKAQFVRVTGRVEAASIGGLAKAVANLWATSTELLAVKIETVQDTHFNPTDSTAPTVALPERIRAGLDDPALVGLFDEMLARV